MSKIEGLNRKFFPGNLSYSPRWIVLGVNNVCNLHCKMCDVGTQNLETNFAKNLVGTSPLHMPLDLFKRIVDQMSRYYPKTKLGYAFTEPLVYKYLEESLHYAKEKDVFTSITTNGLNLRQKAPVLIEGGLKELFISLDGPEEIHNEIRGHKSSYQRAIEGIELIVSQSAIPVSVFCVITEWNIGYLKKFLDELKQLPLQQVGFLHSNFTTNQMVELHNQRFGSAFFATPSNIDEVDFTNYNLDELSAELNEILSMKYPFEVSLHPRLTSTDELKTYYLHPDQKVGKKCLDVFYNLMIKSDGSVIPAHGRCFDLTTGNIYDSSLKEIWNSEKIVELRRALNQEGGLLPACQRCCSVVL